MTPRALTLTRTAARRLCVQGQLLSLPRPKSIVEVVHELGMIQMDPTSAVARTEHLVLFSRLGRKFRIDELERLLWKERALFEYWVHIVPAADHAIHRESMRRYPGGPRKHLKSRARVRAFLKANAGFRRYVLRALEERGPLRSRELEDRAVMHWRSGGWSDVRGRSVSMLMDLLWHKGEVMIAGRDGQQRLWDLAKRRLPPSGERLLPREIARRITERQLRARGVATANQIGWAFDGRAPGFPRALRDLVEEGIAVPAKIEGLPGSFYTHAELLRRPFRPRTVLLSPFDDLVSHRAHTEALFGFFFRLEIYVPKAQRRWGYFVLPILHGDRLIGRIDPLFDREAGVLRLNAVYAEEKAPEDAGAAVAAAVRELADWLGAREVAYADPRRIPAMWRRALTAGVDSP